MNIKIIFLLCISASALCVTHSFAFGGQSSYTRSLNKSHVHGIEITFQKTQQDASGAVTIALNPHRKRTAIATVQKAMQKYPVSVLTRYIDRIIISDAVFVGGHRIGGMVQKNSRIMYLTLDNAYIKRYDLGLSQTFHHEFAHVLTMARPDLFNKAEWTSFLPPNFRYGGSSISAIAGQSASFLHQANYTEGFIKNYGKTNIQEDLATFAEVLFDKRLYAQLAHKSPRVQQKLTLLKQFYLKLNPEFTHYLK